MVLLQRQRLATNARLRPAAQIASVDCLALNGNVSRSVRTLPGERRIYTPRRVHSTDLEYRALVLAIVGAFQATKRWEFETGSHGSLWPARESTELRYRALMGEFALIAPAQHSEGKIRLDS
jgi:hypothetical protein